MRRLCLTLIATAGLGCVGVQAPSPGETDLSGHTVDLLPVAGVRAGALGRVGQIPAEIRFDPSTPLSLITSECFRKNGVPSLDEPVEVPLARGGVAGFPILMLHNAELVTTLATSQVPETRIRLPTIRVGVQQDDQRCALTLGSDVLAPYALTLDPVARQLHISKSRPREEYLASALAAETGAGVMERHVVELSRDLKGDWPMIAVRLKQRDIVVTGSFLLSLTDSQSRISAVAAKAASLKSAPDMVEEFGFAKGTSRPHHFANVHEFQELELAPGFGVTHSVVQSDDTLTRKGLLGVLGADVWGRFVFTVDLQAGIAMLDRPRVLTLGSRQQCSDEKTGEFSEEACFELRSRTDDSGGISLTLSVARDLPLGARIYLEPMDEKGEPVGGYCRVGITFPPSDRGVSSRHQLPWPGLDRALPACAAQLQSASRIQLSMLEDEPLEECPGQCVFVHDLTNGRLSCECAASVNGGLTEAERRFLDLYRRLLQRAPVEKPSAIEPEPED